ncbi:MAG: alanine--tRNA ligase [Clostridia bacterium]|nr:alanine--tRNA ligase [Clostridia bacterium]
MRKISYHELRKMWFDFYQSHDHVVIPSASLVPENDGSVLFTTAGMQPLVPFLLGEKHPSGNRLCDIQKCVRTGDIDEVGDGSHLTFFEMMGNWSLGDYFKKEKVAWSYDFLTNPKYLGLEKDRIGVTAFEGDNVAPRDTEVAEYWKQVGIPENRIWFLPKSENWWQLASGTGPCGPDSEMFYDTGKVPCSPACNPSCDCGKYVEIGNDVYMQYVIREKGGKAEPAKQRNVDTGMGLERLLCFVNGYKTVYDSELFAPAIEIVATNCGLSYEDNLKSFRVLVEHTRAATMILSDGVVPSPTGQGYVLRRLIRRAVRMANTLGCSRDVYIQLIQFYRDFFNGIYQINDDVTTKYLDEVDKFSKTIEQGMREFNKILPYLKEKQLPGKTAFRLYETYGFPIELTQELASENGLTINMDEFEVAKNKHSELSHTASAGMFKGGLADTSAETAYLHTATHLLLAGLKKLLGKSVAQKGSNITPERLRFDFNCDHKLTTDEISFLEKFVNDAIQRKIPVTCQEMPLKDAQALGAEGSFANKYGERVKVYTMGDVSMEICGGPHAQNTGDLVSFKIIKEESSSAGVRRIKAVIKK